MLPAIRLGFVTNWRNAAKSREAVVNPILQDIIEEMRRLSVGPKSKNNDNDYTYDYDR